MSYTLGIDVSHWNDSNATPQRIDFRKAKQAGAQFVFIKASQNNFTDEDFAYNWQAAKDAGLLRGAYHFYDYRYRADKQAEYLWSIIKDDPGELPPVLDAEPYWTPIPGRLGWLSGIQAFLAVIDQLAGRKAILYSNPSTLLSLKPLPPALIEHPLWIAHYGVSSPNPSGWPRWTFWQFTDRLDGIAYGMESKQLDGNYFNGTYADLLAFCKLEQAPTQPESPTEPQPPQGGDDMIRVIYRGRVNRQNIRALPNTSSKVVGTLNAGQELQELIDIACYSPTNIWLKFRDTPAGEGWVALYYGGTTYLTQIV